MGNKTRYYLNERSRLDLHSILVSKEVSFASNFVIQILVFVNVTESWTKLELNTLK